MVDVPAARDVTQTLSEEDYITITPQIRVWCHPHLISKDGDDYFRVFSNFKTAFDFIKKHPEAEEVPLVAFKGWEFNLFAVEKAPLFDSK